MQSFYTAVGAVYCSDVSTEEHVLMWQSDILYVHQFDVSSAMIRPPHALFLSFISGKQLCMRSVIVQLINDNTVIYVNR